MVAGGAISPLLGGLYLAPLDRWMKTEAARSGIRYQRFMDDFVIFAPTRHKLRAVIRKMYRLLDELKLSVHPGKRFIGPTKRGFDFLGYRLHPGRQLRPARQSLDRLRQRARRLHEQGADIDRLRQYVTRWYASLHGRFTRIWELVLDELGLRESLCQTGQRLEGVSRGVGVEAYNTV